MERGATSVALFTFLRSFGNNQECWAFPKSRDSAGQPDLAFQGQNFQRILRVAPLGRVCSLIGLLYRPG